MLYVKSDPSRNHRATNGLDGLALRQALVPFGLMNFTVSTLWASSVVIDISIHFYI